MGDKTKSKTPITISHFLLTRMNADNIPAKIAVLDIVRNTVKPPRKADKSVILSEAKNLSARRQRRASLSAGLRPAFAGDPSPARSGLRMTILTTINPAKTLG